MTDDQKPAVPLDVQIRAVGREIGMRRGAYPRWVKSGRMTQHESDRELAAMEAVYQTLKEIERTAAQPGTAAAGEMREALRTRDHEDDDARDALREIGRLDAALAAERAEVGRLRGDAEAAQVEREAAEDRAEKAEAERDEARAENAALRAARDEDLIDARLDGHGDGQESGYRDGIRDALAAVSQLHAHYRDKMIGDEIDRLHAQVDATHHSTLTSVRAHWQILDMQGMSATYLWEALRDWLDKSIATPPSAAPQEDR